MTADPEHSPPQTKAALPNFEKRVPSVKPSFGRKPGEEAFRGLGKSFEDLHANPDIGTSL